MLLSSTSFYLPFRYTQKREVACVLPFCSAVRPVPLCRMALFLAFVSARAVLACGPALQAGAPSLAFFTTNPFSAPCRGHCQGSVCLAAAMTQQVRPPRNCPRQAHLLRIASACLSLQGVRRAGRRRWCRRLPSRMQTGRRRLRHSVPAGTVPVPHLRRRRPWLLPAAAVPLG